MLAANQSGFHPNRDTMNTIVRLENTAQSALKNKGYALAVSLYLEKAYDLIWIKSLIYKPRQLGITGNMWSLLKSFLTSRTVQVLLNVSRSDFFSRLNGSARKCHQSSAVYYSSE